MRITKISYTDFDVETLTATLTCDMTVSRKSKLAEFDGVDQIKNKVHKIIGNTLKKSYEEDLKKRYLYYEIRYKTDWDSTDIYKFLNIPPK